MLDYRLKFVCPVQVVLGLKLRPWYSKEIKYYHLNIWVWTDGSTVKSTVALSEDEKKLGLIPASTWQLTPSVIPTPRDQHPLLASKGTARMCCTDQAKHSRIKN